MREFEVTLNAISRKTFKLRADSKEEAILLAEAILENTDLLSFSDEDVSSMLVNVMPAFAASDPITVVNNLSDFIFGLIRAVGLILLGWGIVQVGLSLQSHDPSQRSNGFLTLAGGIVITFAKEILTLITG